MWSAYPGVQMSHLSIRLQWIGPEYIVASTHEGNVLNTLACLSCCVVDTRAKTYWLVCMCVHVHACFFFYASFLLRPCPSLTQTEVKVNVFIMRQHIQLNCFVIHVCCDKLTSAGFFIICLHVQCLANVLHHPSLSVSESIRDQAIVKPPPIVWVYLN